MKVTKRRVTTLLGAILVAMAALAALRALSRSMMFPGDPTPLPGPEHLTRLGLGVLDTRTDDGLHLRGIFRAPTGADAPTVLFFHGNGESVARNIDLAIGLGQKGWGVALAEYRGYGGLSGSPTEVGLYKDAEAAQRYLDAQGIRPERIVIVGRSLGTGVAVELARRGYGRALVLVSPFTSMVDMGRSMVGPLAPLAVADRFDSVAKAPEIRMPTLVVHGTHDEVVPFRMGERLAARIPDARFLPLPGVGHNDIPDLAGLLAHEIPPLISQTTRE
jgi:fermentation-respiration switch protein FrsA (DUF1100 family)